MKKNILLIIFVIVAQATQAQIRFGLKAGYNAAYVHSNNAEIKDEGSTLSGFHIGTIMQVPIQGQLAIQTGLTLGTKGVTVAHDDHGDKFKFTALDLPLNLVYNTKKGLFFGTGLNLGYNVSGKLEAHDDPNENYSFEFGSDKNFLRTDFGLNFLVGYQTKSGVFLRGNSLMSLKDIQPAADTWKNNVISFSIGYLFSSSNRSRNN